MISLSKYLHKMVMFRQLDRLYSEFHINIYLGDLDSETKFEDYALDSNFSIEIIQDYMNYRLDKH